MEYESMSAMAKSRMQSSGGLKLSQFRTYQPKAPPTPQRFEMISIDERITIEMMHEKGSRQYQKRVTRIKKNSFDP
jgi:hypothetical protein